MKKNHINTLKYTRLVVNGTLISCAVPPMEDCDVIDAGTAFWASVKDVKLDERKRI